MHTLPFGTSLTDALFNTIRDAASQSAIKNPDFVPSLSWHTIQKGAEEAVIAGVWSRFRAATCVLRTFSQSMELPFTSASQIRSELQGTSSTGSKAMESLRLTHQRPNQSLEPTAGSRGC